MKIEKLELKHLVPYLPFELIAEMLDYESDYVGLQYDRIVGVEQWDRSGTLWSALTVGESKPSIERVKPLLNSLHCLIGGVNIDGKVLIPLYELAKMADYRFHSLIEFIYEPKDNLYICSFFDEGKNKYSFCYVVDKKSFFIKTNNSESKYIYPANQYEMFTKLFEWHLDVFELIESNLAIDKNIFYEL